MKSLHWLFILAGLLSIGSLVVKAGFAESLIASTPLQAKQGQLLPVTAFVQVAGKKIDLEVAQTPSQQAMGLMFRQTLAANRGMLFPFSPPQSVSFWMQNVAIPLDMIFLHQGTVKAVMAKVPPCQTPSCPTYGPSGLIDQVIELRGGRAAELGIKVGDQLTVQRLQTDPATATPQK
jgi:uncharacterized protein